jgi:hypothetical protein
MTSRTRTRKPRTDVAPETIAALAAEYAAWRLGGCPGYGYHQEFAARVKKVAQRHGQGYAELLPSVHAAAYAIIDADGGADLSNARTA